MNASYHRPENYGFLPEQTGASGEHTLLKKRRSHRPRGCRGGGSRRARKAARENQKNDENTEPQIPGKLRTQGILYSIHEGLPSLETSSSSSSGSDDESLMALGVRSTASVQSHPNGGWSEYSILPSLSQANRTFRHQDGNESPMPSGIQASVPYASVLYPPAPRSEFNILPSLSQMQRSSLDKGGTPLMRDLPALPPSSNPSGLMPYSSARHLDIAADSSSNPTRSVQFSSFTNRQDITPSIYEYESRSNEHSQHFIVPFQTQVYHRECDHLPKQVPIEPFVTHKHPPTHYHHPIQPPSEFHRHERIEKQRQMLAEGGSLFLTSPRSFLTGSRNGATSSFF
jgi:hypothetical protein